MIIFSILVLHKKYYIYMDWHGSLMISKNKKEFNGLKTHILTSNH
jgi:hypothetical protein